MQESKQQPDENHDSAPEPWEVPSVEVSGELSARTGWLRLRELEACLAASRRTLSELYPRLGAENITKRGRILWIKAPVIIAEYFRTRMRKLDDEETPNAKAEQERWTRIRADIAELERDKRRGELVEASKVKAIWGVVVGEIRQLGESLQRKYGEDAQRAVVEAVERIETSCREAGGDSDDSSESGT